MTTQQLLELTISRDASDLHLVVGFPPMVKVNGELLSVAGSDILSAAEVDSLMSPLLNQTQKNLYNENWELDFSFDFEGKARFRANLYRQKGYPAISLRLIPLIIRTLAELELPSVIGRITDLKQGLILMTGPTGHGKSTALAALIQRINESRAVHIVTIEDPIEYVYPPGKALISQREVYADTKSWKNALRSVLREDPDVVFIGEMRDLETISSAITIAETGHLVFATLHTNSAAQAIDRIIDVFPENQQSQIRLQLAASLETVISIRLVPTISPGRVPATEILFANLAARNMIREGKTYLIDNLIQTSAELGMNTLENSLASLVWAGKISPTEALKFTLRPDLLSKLLNG